MSCILAALGHERAVQQAVIILNMVKLHEQFVGESAVGSW